MKRILPLLLSLLLLLSGCGLSDQLASVRETYIEPAIERADSGLSGTEAESSRPVQTNRSGFAGFTPLEPYGSRVAEGALTEYTPSESYGSILPYVGAVYGETGRKYGIVTAGGAIALDPVLTSAEFAEYRGESLGALIAGRYTEEGTMYALLGLDGSWATDFEFTEVLPMELGLLCIRDLEANLASCYASDGSLVFDTANFASLYELAPASVESLADCGSGYMRICYSNGQFGFIDRNGVILNRSGNLPSYFDEVRPFSEGKAAVKLYDTWNYIDARGGYAIYGSFAEAGDFTNGLAIVRSGDSLLVVDENNATRLDITGAASATAYERYIEVGYSDGSVRYYLTPSLTEANIYDHELAFSDEGYWVRGADGVRMRSYDGVETYFAGAIAYIGSAGEGLSCVLLADGSFALLDANSRATLAAQQLYILRDRVSGEVYVGDGEGNVYSTLGLRLLSGATPGEPPVNGAFSCTTPYYTGWCDAEGEWIFRTLIDTMD